MAAPKNDISKTSHGIKNVQLLHFDCDSKSRELPFEFSDNSNEVLEENNVPGSDKINHSSSYFLADETGADVTGKKRIVREKHSIGYKADFISNAFKSIALLRSFNLYERNTGKKKEIPKQRVEQSKLIGKMCFYMIFLALPSGINASVIISPSQYYTTFENNASTFTFNCSGNGTSLLWIVDGQSAGSQNVLNKGIQYTPFIVSPDTLTVSSQLIVPTTTANNNITVICAVQDQLFNHQSSNPVKLYLQGILQAPQQFTLSTSNSAVNISWIVPDSLQVSTPPTISHYVLCNNLINATKTFNNPTACNPLAYCNYSLDLRDSFFISVGSLNATIFDYNSTIIFTFFAVNGAGNGNSTTYVYQRKTTGDVNNPSQSVPSAQNVPYITTASSNSAITTPINVIAVVVVAVGVLLCMSVPMLVIVVQCVRKQKSSPIATIDTTFAINNEYVTQSTFVTQVDDPYFVHVPLYLHQSRTNNPNSQKRSHLNVEFSHSDAATTPMRTHQDD